MVSFFLSLLLLTLFAVLPAESACRNMDMSRGLIARAYAAEPDAIIQYFGHNFFQITTGKGTKIVTDPLTPGMYPTPNVAPHVVTVGREHPNHNYVRLVQGDPIILRGLTLTYLGGDWNRLSTRVRDVFIYNVPISHRGFGEDLKGAAFVFDLGTLCVVHLGDLGHTLTDEQIQAIGRVDVALIPIGGRFTMGPETAREVLQQLNPKIAIPMHYRDNLAILAAFVEGLPTRRLDRDTLMVSKASLPETTDIIVLRPWPSSSEE